MEKTGFDYEITILVKMTKEEWDVLWESYGCVNEMEQYRQPGTFLWGNKNRMEWGDNLRFTWGELDKSLKALEIASIDVTKRPKFNDLYGKIYNLMSEFSDEYRRVRKESEKPFDIEKVLGLSEKEHSQSFKILFGNEWKKSWSNCDRAREMRSILRGDTQPCVPFENWVKCIDFLKLKCK